MCALERGMVIDERGRCVCPIEHGYRLNEKGECIPESRTPGCSSDDECADHLYCNPTTRQCEDPCQTKTCGTNALCNVTKHKPICKCEAGLTGNPDVYCSTLLFLCNFFQVYL